MADVSVATAARQLGIAPATLRTWDRRYGIGPSDHAPGRHRRYSPDDLARLALMQHALVRGVSPAEAARLALGARLPRHGDPEPDRPRVVDRPPAVPDAGPTSPTADGDPVPADTDGPREAGSRVGARALRLTGAGRRARGLGRAALSLDSAAAAAVLADAIAADGVQVAWEEVAAPVLRSVGDRWASTGAGAEIEHLLSHCVIGVFSAHAERALTPAGRPVVLAGMPGERHILPLIVLAAALAERGVPSRSLGPDLPVDALMSAVRRTAPAAVVLWSQLPHTADAGVLRALPRTRPRARLFLGGPGWTDVALPSTVGRLDALASAVDTVAAAASPT